MQNIRLFVFALMSLLALSAHADWADPRAAYLCDKKGHAFLVKAVMLTSSPDKGTVLQPPGYSTFNSDKKFKCVIGKTIIDADIEVREPHPGGNCAAYTYTVINSLRVNGEKFFPDQQFFNDACSDAPVLYKIEIRSVGAKVHAEACYANWGWGVGFTETSCVVKDF
jgi:hypothetical protein